MIGWVFDFVFTQFLDADLTPCESRSNFLNEMFFIVIISKTSDNLPTRLTLETSTIFPTNKHFPS